METKIMAGYGRREAPRTVRELKQRVLAGRLAFPPQTVAVLRFALERPDVTAFATAQYLALHCKVAETTVLRASKLAGFSRFSEFRAVFRAHLLEMHPSLDLRNVSRAQEPGIANS